MSELAVVGPGSVGVYFAAHAAVLGRDVLSCARRPFDEYVVESPFHPCRVPATVVTDPAQVDGPVPFVLVTLKSQHTAGAGEWLERLCDADTVVVAAQNGIEAEARLAPYVNGATVLQSVVYCATELMAPGHTVHRGTGWLYLPVCEASQRFAALYEGSLAEMRVTEQYHTELWRKLGLNATSNGITALTRKRFNVFEDERIGTLGEHILFEAWTIGNADGAELDLGSVQGISKFLAKQGEESATSTYYDRMAGRPTEHDAIYGAIVRAGERLGIPTPYNSTIWALLAAGD